MVVLLLFLLLLMIITNAKEATEKDVFPFRAVWSSHTSSFWHRSSHMFDLFWKRAWLSKHTYTQCAYISYTICIINAHADIITLARQKSRVRILITFSNSLSRSRTSWIKQFGRRFHRNVQISAAPYHALNHARHNKNKTHTTNSWGNATRWRQKTLSHSWLSTAIMVRGLSSLLFIASSGTLSLKKRLAVFTSKTDLYQEKGYIYICHFPSAEWRKLVSSKTTISG